MKAKEEYIDAPRETRSKDITVYAIIFNHNFPWHSRSFQEVGEKKGGKNGSTRKMRNQKSQCSCGFAGKKFP